MKLIIPMAGMGKRMRPHTLTIPKPLIRIAGKPIVQRLVEAIVNVIDNNLDEIAYIVGDFGAEVEKNLLQIAENAGSKGKIYYQQEPLGTAHAIYCAAESLNDSVVVAFADTLFRTFDKMDFNSDGSIWVHSVKDPSSFGVVLTDNNGYVTEFVEKPQDFVSSQAIVGVYYFKDGAKLKDEIQNLIDKKIMKGGEYQLTDVLQNMLKKGTKFTVYSVPEWLDCGNKNAILYTNKRILENSNGEKLIKESVQAVNTIIIPPCYIGENVILRNSIIGPHVSIGEGTKISQCIISNSIVQSFSKISNANFDNSMLGNFVDYKEKQKELNIGDFTVIS